jgi:RimJ/RimL family protein N-acetyltransferase
MLFEQNIILENDFVLLKPLSIEDKIGFIKIAFDKDIWRYSVNRIYDEAELDQFISEAISSKEKQLRFPFTIIDKIKNKIAGSTSLGNYSIKDKRIEIGWTWLGKEFWRTGLNLLCKNLLVTFVFEKSNAERIEFKTDILNIAARKSLLKLGAIEEGILRSHTLMHDGRRRDTIYYSILKKEWINR